MTPHEFLSIFTISCIAFTLLIKAMTINKIAKKTNIACLTRDEEFTLHQVNELLDKKIIHVLNKERKKPHVDKEVFDKLLKEYIDEDLSEIQEIEKLNISQENFKRILQKYAL
jgi:hypothetical protein